jgi:hypothetical protein
LQALDEPACRQPDGQAQRGRHITCLSVMLLQPSNQQPTPAMQLPSAALQPTAANCSTAHTNERRQGLAGTHLIACCTRSGSGVLFELPSLHCLPLHTVRDCDTCGWNQACCDPINIPTLHVTPASSYQDSACTAAAVLTAGTPAPAAVTHCSWLLCTVASSCYAL